MPDQPKTDFASTPMIARAFIPKIGFHTEAAVVHDHLFRNPTEDNPTSAKIYADTLLLEATKVTNMDRVSR